MNANDPRLTAHALGEADAESAEIIARDPALAAEASEIGRLAAHLRTEFQGETTHPLLPSQRAEVFAAAKIASGPSAWRRFPAIGAAAACVAVGLAAMAFYQARHVRDLWAATEARDSKPREVTITFKDETRLLHDEPVVPPKTRTVSTQPSFSSGPTIVLTHESGKSPVPVVSVASTPSPLPANKASSGTLPPDAPRMNASPLRPQPGPRNR